MNAVNTIRFVLPMVVLALVGCETEHHHQPAPVYYSEPPPQVISQPAQPAPQVVYANPGTPATTNPNGIPGATVPQQPAPVVVQQQPQVVQQQPLVVQQPVIVQSAPPAPVVEAVPVSPGVEFVWTPGHWWWNGRWVWSPGVWVRPPHHHAVWVRGGWVRERHGYRWHEGHWR